MFIFQKQKKGFVILYYIITHMEQIQQFQFHFKFLGLGSGDKDRKDNDSAPEVIPEDTKLPFNFNTFRVIINECFRNSCK